MLDDDQLPTNEVEPNPAGLGGRLNEVRHEAIKKAADTIVQMGKRHPKLREIGVKLYGLTSTAWEKLRLSGTEVEKFGPVGESVYRGAQPGEKAWQTLRDLGIQTVINLRPESDRERATVEKLGFKYIYMPFPPMDKPSHSQIIEFLHTVTDPINGTVFFHCFHGVDRTGMVAACLRIARDGWTAEQALVEMREFGVHESGQQPKIKYVQEFEGYWASLPEADRRQILHLPSHPAIILDEQRGLLGRVRQAWVRLTGWIARITRTQQPE